jgi:hypothetical protein
LAIDCERVDLLFNPLGDELFELVCGLLLSQLAYQT